MPGRLSVQAMTSSATVAPCASARGRISSAKATALPRFAGAEPGIADAQVVAREDPLGADLAGEQAERERRVAQDGDAVAGAERHQLGLDVAMDHAELFLDRVERPGGDIGLEVGRRDVAGADRADLAGAPQVLERTPSSRRSASSGPASG